MHGGEMTDAQRLLSRDRLPARRCDLRKRCADSQHRRLRRRGAAFRQAICTTTTTTPSFSSMLTGRYPPHHGVRGLQGYRLSSAATTMAEAFGKAGYSTHAEITGPLLPETGILRGFDEANHRPGYKAPFFGWRDEVIERIHSYADPWFMLLHIWEVHRPYRSPPDFEKRKDKAGYEAAVAASDDYLKPIFDARRRQHDRRHHRRSRRGLPRVAVRVSTRSRQHARPGVC